MGFDPITAVADLIKVGLEKWIPDANERTKAAMEMATQVHQQVMGQIEINKVEASSTSLFVAGWRPAIGWICGGAYGYHFILQPFMVFILQAFGNTILLPHLDIGELSMVLFGLLGLGAMRSWDKSIGTTK